MNLCDHYQKSFCNMLYKTWTPKEKEKRSETFWSWKEKQEVNFVNVLWSTPILILISIMRNTFCLNQVKFITEYTNVQHVIITQIN